jgi:sulfate permease, SulP family
MKDFSIIGGDLSGALSAAIISLPVSIGYGVIAFASLGTDFSAQAASIGLHAVIFGGFFAALLGGLPTHISAPSALITLIYAMVVAGLAASPAIPTHLPHREVLIVGLAALCVLIAGVSQVLCRQLHLGRLVKCVPLPVVAGFLNGIAVLLIWKQLPFLAGFKNGYDLRQVLDNPGSVNLLTVTVGLTTLGMIFFTKRYLKWIPPTLIGVITGSGVYYLLLFQFDGFDPGSLIGRIGIALPVPDTFGAVIQQVDQIRFSLILPNLVGYGIVIGLLASLESLLSILGMGNLTETRPVCRRELFGQGVGNIVASFFGPLPLVGSISKSTANYRGGGRTRLSGLFCSGFILLFAVMAAPIISRIPLAVIAGVIISVGIYLFDNWTLHLLKTVRNPANLTKEVLIDFLVILCVALVAITIDLITAVLAGVFISMVYFVIQMGKSMVRRQYSGDQIHSKKARNLEHREQLENQGHKIKVFELEGPLFFGSADRLASVIEKAFTRTHYCILDMRRVHAIDSTGACLLRQAIKRLKNGKKMLLISYITADHGLWQFLNAMGVVEDLGGENFFADTDHALEWAEDDLLSATRTSDVCREYDLEAMDIVKGFDSRELDIFRDKLNRKFFRKGKRVIREGQKERDLFMLARGAVSIYMHLPQSDRTRRLFTFDAGVVFGEMALLDGKPRSADVLADEDSEAFQLSYSDFVALRRDYPRIASKLIMNVAFILNQRLRIRSEEVRLLTDC